MIIDCIADLHGFYPELEGGDLLIVAGDYTASDTIEQHQAFMKWLEFQNYTKKILIAGNHDNAIEDGADYDFPELGIHYLEDSGTEFEGLKIWGSPWTKTFEGMNTKCKAFTFDTEEELDEKFKMIPNDTDILITHSPSWGMLDRCSDGKLVGSPYLSKYKSDNCNTLKLHISGHIHEAYGCYNLEHKGKIPIHVNASYVDEDYEPVNKPIRIIL